MPEAYKMQEGGFFSAYSKGHTKNVHAKQNVFICVFNSTMCSASKLNESQSISHLSKQTLFDYRPFNDYLKFQHIKISCH